RVILTPTPSRAACDEPVLRGVHPTRLERRQLSLLGEDRFAVVRMDLAAPQGGIGHPLGRSEAEDPLDLRADVDPAPVGRELGDVDDAVGAVDDRLEAL